MAAPEIRYHLLPDMPRWKRAQAKPLCGYPRLSGYDTTRREGFVDVRLSDGLRLIACRDCQRLAGP